MKKEQLQIAITFSCETVGDEILYNLVIFCTHKGRMEHIKNEDIVLSGYSEMLQHCFDVCLDFYGLTKETACPLFQDIYVFEMIV